MTIYIFFSFIIPLLFTLLIFILRSINPEIISKEFVSGANLTSIVHFLVMIVIAIPTDLGVVPDEINTKNSTYVKWNEYEIQGKDTVNTIQHINVISNKK